ncbi:sphingosine N-acyltransferase lac1 [Puccinia graminis f. sp. tritici]|nr:sphingosine N-acyltransferase lac1 [Puccinia graminis f. sp. tritici]
MSAAVTIHWHGIFQRESPWMDGVTGVTQCPIPPGHNFTYSFKINNQYGTFWYHAHAQNFNSDGIAGPMIVHSVNDPLKRGVDFHQDIILLINDWYHDMSQSVLQQLLSPTGYNNSLAAPSPNSALVNGIGYFDCNNAPANATCTTPNQSLTFDVPVGTKTRFRLIGAGSHALFRFSVDEHTLNVTETDSTGVVGPPAIHRVPFHNGERYSVIIDTSRDTVGSTVYLRAAMDTDCFAWLAPGITGRAGTALGIIRIVDPKRLPPSNSSVALPTTSDWSDTIGGACLDLDVSTMRPLVPQDACTNLLGTVYFSTSFGTIASVNGNSTSISGRFFVNGTTWITRPNRPLLNELLSGGPGTINASDVAAFTFEQPGCYDIVINNLDAALDHSYHLHGVDGWIVATGSGQINATTVSSLQYNTTNPLRKDTQVVGGGSYHVVRVQADNPGVWILHCHLGWHLGAGFAGMVVMQPSVLRQKTAPEGNQRLCRAISPQDLDIIEPGKRRRGLPSYAYSDVL